MYPSTYYESEVKAAATRSVILVSTALSTNTWTAIEVGSPDVTAIELRTAELRVRIFNIYNDCNNDSALEAVEAAIERLRPTDAQDTREVVMIWLGDFNRHHPTWDEARNEHLFTRANLDAAEQLISMMVRHDMAMALPENIPTLVAFSSGNLTRVDNVFVSRPALESVSLCETRPADRPVRTDHYPIWTTVECEVARAPEESRRNFRKVDWDDFRNTMMKALDDAGGCYRVKSIEDLRRLYNMVVSAINAAVTAHVPLSKPSHIPEAVVGARTKTSGGTEAVHAEARTSVAGETYPTPVH